MGAYKLVINFVLPCHESFLILLFRPILVLKCEQGFVGPKGVRLECNKANYETIQVIRGPKGAVYFKGKASSIHFKDTFSFLQRLPYFT